jgi:excisionase family DNA binding protein
MGTIVNLDRKPMGLAEVAELLGVCTATILRSVRAGRFPAPARLGKKMYWARETVAAFLAPTVQHAEARA